MKQTIILSGTDHTLHLHAVDDSYLVPELLANVASGVTPSWKATTAPHNELTIIRYRTRLCSKIIN
jgi:hypothetical protein